MKNMLFAVDQAVTMAGISRVADGGPGALDGTEWSRYAYCTKKLPDSMDRAALCVISPAAHAPE